MRIPARCLLTVVLVCASGGISAVDGPFQLERDDRIVIAGNTFAERMALYGYFETLLHCRFPDHRLVVRNLGWSGDEVDLMPRPANFGSFHEHLKWHKADVTFLCFGLNESFAGDRGIDPWRDRLTRFLSALEEQTFHRTPPRLVLISPIAHEDLGPPLPTGDAIVERNRILGAYTAVMKEVAEARGVRFLDLFTPTRDAMEVPGAPKLTFNGIHLTERGYHQVSRMMARSLGLWGEGGEGPALDPPAAPAAERLRRQIYEKNRLFFLFWRPLNPFYIWGGRAYCWKRDEPMIELERLAQMIDAREREIWSTRKPPTDAVWATPPGDREIWEEPLDHAAHAEGSDDLPPQLDSVRRNGVIK